MPAVPRIAAMIPPTIMPVEVPPTGAGELVGLGDTEELRTPDELTMVWMTVGIVVGVDVVRD